MLFSRVSMIVGLVALTLGNPPVLAQSNTPSPFSISPHSNALMMAQMDHQMMGDDDLQGEPRGMGGRMLERLNLTDAQRQQIEQIHQRYQDQMQPLHQQLITQQNELRDLMAGNASDREIRDQHNQVLATRHELGNLHFNSMLEMRNLLNQDQRQQLTQMMENHRNQGGFNQDNNNNSQGRNRPNGQGRRNN